MPFSSRFVGRIAELDALDAALTALEDGTPRAVEVVGPAGIGKSRLLSELGARADARGHVVLSGSGAELEQDLPYWVFVDALDDYVAGLEPRRLDRLDATTRSELAQFLPALTDPAATFGTGLHERYRTHRAARTLLERLAVPKPVVLLLDDFHWADPASTDLLSALLHRPPAAGVLIALAARPRQLPTRLATALDRAHRAGVLARVELPPLTRNETRELVGEYAEIFYDETGGNPFYLEQLARAPTDTLAAADRRDVSLAGVPVHTSASRRLCPHEAPERVHAHTTSNVLLATVMPVPWRCSARRARRLARRRPQRPHGGWPRLSECFPTRRRLMSASRCCCRWRRRLPPQVSSLRATRRCWRFSTFSRPIR
jgi:hypothetical protein